MGWINLRHSRAVTDADIGKELELTDYKGIKYRGRMTGRAWRPFDGKYVRRPMTVYQTKLPDAAWKLGAQFDYRDIGGARVTGEWEEEPDRLAELEYRLEGARVYADQWQAEARRLQAEINEMREEGD